MKKYFCVTLAAFSLATHAQFDNPTAKAIRTISTNGNIIDKVIEEKAEGSPFYSDSYLTAKISNVDFIVPLKYNLMTDELEFLKEGQVYIVPKVSTYQDIDFTLTGEKLILIDNSYYFVLDKKNENYLLKKSSVVFTPARPSKNGYDADIPPRYSRKKDQFFIFTKEHVLQPVSKAFEVKTDSGMKKMRFNMKNEQTIKESFQSTF